MVIIKIYFNKIKKKIPMFKWYLITKIFLFDVLSKHRLKKLYDIKFLELFFT